MDESMVYVARNRCGCIGALRVDDPEHLRDTAKFVSKAVLDGMTLEQRPIEWVRSDDCSLKPCADNPDCVRLPKPKKVTPRAETVGMLL